MAEIQADVVSEAGRRKLPQERAAGGGPVRSVRRQLSASAVADAGEEGVMLPRGGERPGVTDVATGDGRSYNSTDLCSGVGAGFQCVFDGGDQGLNCVGLLDVWQILRHAEVEGLQAAVTAGDQHGYAWPVLTDLG